MAATKLARMANQIGSFFASEPDHALAMEGVASHLRRTWEPRMRLQLIAWMDETGVPSSRRWSGRRCWRTGSG